MSEVKERERCEGIEIDIPNFITHIKLSEKRKAKYYRQGNKIPKRYKNPVFDSSGFLLDKGEKVISNPRSMGTPDLWCINGQSIYASMNHNKRSTVMKKLKAYFKSKLKEAVNARELMRYPLKVSLELHRYRGYYNAAKKRWEESFDLDNVCWVLQKSIQDALTELTVIEDDNVNYINEIAYKFIPIPKKAIQRLVIRLDFSEGKEFLEDDKGSST